jgi:hypothetical protein
MKYLSSLLACACLCPLGAAAKDDATTLLAKTSGDATLAKVVVDTAPGSVSAMDLLGLSGDQTSAVQNPRNLTLALKTLDGKNAFGLSITPARTSLMPMNISTYNDSPAARWWAATTFSYAQGRADVSGATYRRRAAAVETSYFFFPHKDDPLVMYWDALERAAGDPADEKNSCMLHPAEHPDGRSTEELKMALDARAQACREKVAKSARWNVSRMWASLASGQYQPDSGGASHSLGHTAVLGVTWGIGDAGASTAGALTAAMKRASGAPVLSTFANASPATHDTNLVTLRAALGSSKLRAVLEGSNVKDQAPTAVDRTYKRSLGLDVNLAEGWWLIFRVGKQRRIDNNGDETGSSANLSYSPKALLDF